MEMIRISLLILLVLIPVANINAQTCNLHDAAKNGNTASVIKMLAADCAVDKKDSDEYTPLHWAVMGKHPEIIRLLLEAGADVNAEGKKQ